MKQRLLGGSLIACLTLALFMAGCSDAHSTERAQTQLAQYRNDPLTAPVDLGLSLSDPPDLAGLARPDRDNPPTGAPGQHDQQIVYWFAVPEGSDRDTLLDLAASELEERGWELIVTTEEVRVLTATPSTDNLRTTVIMPDPNSAHLAQEIRIQR